MKVDKKSLSLRAKVLGALIRDARLASEKDLQTCAEAVGVSKERFESYELGEASPSLPELEALAYMLDISLEHFWEKESLSSRDGKKEMPDMERLIQLRQRMIGAMLRQARTEADVQLDRLAEYMDVSVQELEAYELGEKAVPLPQLEVLSGVLNRSIREFQDQHGPVGQWRSQNQALQDFVELPLELQVFITRPVNRPYLDLAVRLSGMSVDQLRSVAEGLLEITY